jgi:FkbM family methyltransferase
MESDACYHFSTVAAFCVHIRRLVDVGANDGRIACEIAERFPQATILCFEPHPVHFAHVVERTGGNQRIRVRQAAITAEHLFADDLGNLPRRAELRLFEALPSFGGGWEGSSRVRAPDANFYEHSYDHRSERFRRLDGSVEAITLDELVAEVGDIDYLKSDCEGSECSFLGCARPETLRRIRFVAGEYHSLKRFYNVMENRLFATHYVNIVGDAQLGSFFCERITDGPTLLLKKRYNRRVYPHLNEVPMEWNEFDRQYVPREERANHGISEETP